MRITLITNIISPHQLPLARQLVARLGAANFRYVATVPVQQERAQLGWVAAEQPPWVIESWRQGAEAQTADEWLRDSDVVLCGNRDLDLFARRLADHKTLLYMTERWFKPPLGRARLLHPGFLRMALRFRRLAQSPHFHHLAIGRHAAQDMRRVCALPDRSWLWGYFVDPSADCQELIALRGSAPTIPDSHVNCRSAAPQRDPHTSPDTALNCRSAAPQRDPHPPPLRVLWVGRMLGWKRVDTLIRAVALCRAQGSACHLRIIGQGPRESDLKRLALRGTCNDAITFEPSIPIDSVRAAMRQADVYVLPSNGYEGWGAVVNEAMLEACCVVATREAGSASTLIRHGENGLLFQSGDVQGLAEQLLHLEQDEPLRKRLAQAGQQTLLTDWTPAVAAERLLELSEALIAGRPPPIYTEGPLQQL